MPLSIISFAAEIKAPHPSDAARPGCSCSSACNEALARLKDTFFLLFVSNLSQSFSRGQEQCPTKKEGLLLFCRADSKALQHEHCLSLARGTRPLARALP